MRSPSPFGLGPWAGEIFDQSRQRGPDQLGDAVANLRLAGVPKAGTTSLFEYLGQHPEICASTYKGPGYISPLRRGEALPSLDSYRKNFAHCAGQRHAMEATPSYAMEERDWSRTSSERSRAANHPQPSRPGRPTVVVLHVAAVEGQPPRNRVV